MITHSGILYPITPHDNTLGYFIPHHARLMITHSGILYPITPHDNTLGYFIPHHAPLMITHSGILYPITPHFYIVKLCSSYPVTPNFLPRLGKRELIFLLLFTCNYVVSVWRGFLFLWVFGMGYVILLWHSLSRPIIILQSKTLHYKCICRSPDRNLARSGIWLGQIGILIWSSQIPDLA